MRAMPADFSSSMVNPRPRRTLVLYLTVGQCTRGRSCWVGRGATRRAFSMRALWRRCLRSGWLNHVLMKRCQSLRKWAFGTTPLRFPTMMDAAEKVVIRFQNQDSKETNLFLQCMLQRNSKRTRGKTCLANSKNV